MSNPTQHASLDLTGCALGGYRILRKIGQGGMATVYKAHEESLNRVVALKVIGRHLSDQPEFIERFRREAQTAAQLSHPHIVQVYAIGEDDGVYFFSMEYVKGESLDRLTKRHGFLTVSRAVPLIAQITQALVAAHDARIVHRDIKPANILIDDVGRVKVADFGIAQMLTSTRLTQSGAVVGTPEYMSPEQCRGDTLDERTDIYALGVTFYQTLTGRPPFDADSAAALALRIVEGQVPRLESLNPTVPPEVREVVARMMAPDRERRFQTAEALLDALDTLEVGIAEPPSAPLTTVPAKPRAHVSALPRSPVVTTVGERRRPDMPPRRRLVAVTVLALGVVLAIALAWRTGPTAPDIVLGPPPAAGDSGRLAQLTSGARVIGAERAASPTEDPPRDLRPAPVREDPPDEDPRHDIASEPAPAAIRAPATETADSEEPVAATVPPDNVVVVSTSGDLEYVDLVGGWVEAALVARGYEVVDGRSSPPDRLADLARFDVEVTVLRVGTRQLEFFGQRHTQYTVALTMRATDHTDGLTAGGPVSSTVQHTSLNLHQKLQAAARSLTSRLAHGLTARAR